MIEKLRIAIAIVGAAGAALVLGPLHLVYRRITGGATGPATRLWHAIVVRLLGIRVTTRGQMVKSRPLLLVANHISWTDIMVLGSRAPVVFVAKSDMAAWPGIGTIARWGGSIFVERDKRTRSGAQANEVSRILRAGEPVVLFAEGTTGDGNRLLPFKTSLLAAARMAVDDGDATTVMLQPVTLSYTAQNGMPLDRNGRIRVSWIGDEALSPHLFAIAGEGALDVEVVFGEPVAFSAGSDRKAVSRELEDRIAAQLVALQRGREAAP